MVAEGWVSESRPPEPRAIRLGPFFIRRAQRLCWPPGQPDNFTDILISVVYKKEEVSVISIAIAITISSLAPSQPPTHQDNIAPSGYVSEEYFSLVHTPISLKEASKIPKAMEALRGE